MQSNPPIFLSSCFADPPGMRLHIRDEIRKKTGGEFGPEAALTRPVWMAEDYPELKPESHWGEFEKTEFCLEGVRRTECFVAIVTERHGTQITVEGVGRVPTSFFEAELFEAALLGKPSFIFLLDGYEPEGKLADLLKLLKPAFPNMNLTPVSQDEILRQIERLVKYYQRPRWLRGIKSPPRLRMMVDTQISLRHRPYDPKFSPPPLRFLDKQFDPSLPEPDRQMVIKILERAQTEQEHHVRLTLVWFAIRALMGAPYLEPAYKDMLEIWEHAFEMWTSSGAWYGLHGYFPMSCLAALGSLAEIRTLSATGAESTADLPHGALASIYYSIAKHASRSSEISDLALTHIELGIASERGNIANQIATRASILLQLGRSDPALRDFQRVAELREDKGGKAYGEALSEWGYAMLKTGEKTKGVMRMEEGLEMLEEPTPSGFQIRAMRKLAEGYVRCWKIGAAIDLSAEAYDLAQSIGAHDQIHSLERLAKFLKKK